MADLKRTNSLQDESAVADLHYTDQRSGNADFNTHHRVPGRLRYLNQRQGLASLRDRALGITFRVKSAHHYVIGLKGRAVGGVAKSMASSTSTGTFDMRQFFLERVQEESVLSGQAFMYLHYADMPGAAGLDRRINQLVMNKMTTTTFEMPWMSPMYFARVPSGIPTQSMIPNTAAISPPMIPDAIIQYDTSAQ